MVDNLKHRGYTHGLDTAPLERIAGTLRYIADKVKALAPLEGLAVMHGDAPDVDEFVEMVSASFPRDQIIVGDIGAVIGTHAGRGVIGVGLVVPA